MIKPEGTVCPVWGVSYNALWLDCSINIDGLSFHLDNTKLKTGFENGKLYLELDPRSAIPMKSPYVLMAKRGSEVVGSLNIKPKMLPTPTTIPELSRLAYGVRSGNVTILNENTIYLPNFSYDGKGPDAYFWVGKGKPGSDGQVIPDENGFKNILGAYNKKSVILKLPEGLTVNDIDYLSVWCRQATVNFGSVMIPQNIMVPPASFMPLVADYSQIAITMIDSNEVLPFDAMGKEENGSPNLNINSYLILLPAIFIMYK